MPWICLRFVTLKTTIHIFMKMKARQENSVLLGGWGKRSGMHKSEYFATLILGRPFSSLKFNFLKMCFKLTCRGNCMKSGCFPWVPSNILSEWSESVYSITDLPLLWSFWEYLPMYHWLSILEKRWYKHLSFIAPASTYSAFTWKLYPFRLLFMFQV